MQNNFLKITLNSSVGILFFVTILLSVGCFTTTKVFKEQPLVESEITFLDIQNASRLCIEDLIIDDFLNDKQTDKPFIIIDKIKNNELAHINTDFLAQEVRLSLLLSDKAITAPAEELKKGEKKKPTHFNYFLSGEVGNKNSSESGENINFFYIKYQLTDIESDDIVWEKEEILKK